MKKKIITLSVISLLTFGLIGCRITEDVVNDEIKATSSNRFIDTGDKYIIANNTFSVWYDSNTEIVYLVKQNGHMEHQQ